MASTFYKFLWNNGPEKVKRTCITQKFEDGGLAMLDLNNFIIALKVKWIKNYMITNNNYTWRRLLNNEIPKLESIYYYGDAYIQNLLKKLGNPKSKYNKNNL